MNHNYRYRRSSRRNRKGTALVLAVALMFVLFSFLAFGIDTGYLAQSRAEMQRTADASAMAGCWELYGNLEQGYELESSVTEVTLAAKDMAALNAVCLQAPVVPSNDIDIGFVPEMGEGDIQADSSLPFYAVKVDVKKNQSNNGEVPFFFGRIFGNSGRPMEVSATAVMARQISGFSIPAAESAKIDLLPFALDVETWDNMMSQVTTSDGYVFDQTANEVRRGQDGIFEVNLYPQGTGSPGNRGTVDIGSSNNSTSDIARQIVDGISASDLTELGKPLVIDGSSPLELNGDTGISAGVKDELASIIGQKRIIPLFSRVTGNGNNAKYEITRWVGVRIMRVKLTGPMSRKELIVQPAHVVASTGVIATTGSTVSDHVLSPVLLVR